MASWADGLGRLGLIALGGGVGSAGRYLTAGMAHRILGAGFPYGTLAVNAIGCFVIGWLNVRLLASGQFSPEIRSAVTIGVLGGFTTFSTFSWETLEMMNDRQFGRAALNVGVNVTISLLAVWVGYRLAMREVGTV